MYKTAAPSNLSGCIVQSLLLLLQDNVIRDTRAHMQKCNLTGREKNN